MWKSIPKLQGWRRRDQSRKTGQLCLSSNHTETAPKVRFETDQQDSTPAWSWFWEDGKLHAPEVQKRSTSREAHEVYANTVALAVSPTRKSDTHFAFQDGEQVEFYSRTHGLWLHAAVGTEICSQSGAPQYNVTLRGSKQRRRGVGLELLRMPLQIGECCEVFSIRDEWWSLGKVVGSSNGVVPGYEVLFSDLDGHGPMVSMVSAAVVRRVFPVGSRLLVYKGVVRGWVKAVATPPDELDEPVSWAPEDGPDPQGIFGFGAAVGGATPSTLSQQTIAPGSSAASRGPKRSDGSALDCLFMLPIREVASGAEICIGDCEREFMPSYLVRLQPDTIAQFYVEDPGPVLLPEEHSDAEVIAVAEAPGLPRNDRWCWEC